MYGLRDPQLKNSTNSSDQVHGRVMLDPETSELTHPGANGVPSINTISRKSLENDDEKMLLVNSLVYGYSLGDKIWGKVFMPNYENQTNRSNRQVQCP